MERLAPRPESLKVSEGSAIFEKFKVEAVLDHMENETNDIIDTPSFNNTRSHDTLNGISWELNYFSLIKEHFASLFALRDIIA